jgi:ribosome-associated protein
MANKKEDSIILIDKIIQGIENVKGESIQKMDLRKIENTPFEFFVICSGSSNTQVSAIVSSIQKNVSKTLYEKPLHTEGLETSEWAEVVALNSRIAALDTQLTTVVELTGVSFDQITAQPAIDATVVRAVHEISPGIVALNRGSSDGVKVGYTFEIYNGNEYKGQVRVENVRAEMCTALVTTSVSGTKIGQGDSAATRL